MRILDIDLDFFLNELSLPNGSTERWDPGNILPWDVKEVVNFLENQCGLSKNDLIEGRIVTQHHEAFCFWRELIEKDILKTPFEIVHIDAHADLGTGDGSGKYITEQLLHMSFDERMYPNVEETFGLYETNYLIFAVACRWVSGITYVSHPMWENDLCWYHWKDYDETTGFLQLKKYNPGGFQRVSNKPEDRPIPIELEPAVPFERIDRFEYHNSEKFSFIVLSHSPAYTPPDSDKLIPAIKEYIKEI